MANLSQEEWENGITTDENAVILDVRTDVEFEQGYIPNAKNLDIHLGEEFIDEIKALDPNKTYYIYCRSGARSAQACSVMNDLGFKTTHNLLGGILQWEGDIEE